METEKPKTTNGRDWNLGLERLGFKLISVDVEREEVLMKHPGASITDFDIDHQPKIWKMMAWVGYGKAFAHHQVVDSETGRIFLDHKELTKDRLLFARASELEFTRDVYNNHIDKQPVYIKVKGGYIGTSSYISIAEVTSTSGHLLITNTDRVIGVDIVTRKPLPIPDWYRERHARPFHNRTLNLEQFVRPDGTKYKTMKVHWSNLDWNVHATWHTYIIMTIDTAGLLVKEGHLIHFRENKLRGLNKLQLQFLGESLEGDELDIYVWEDSKTYIMRSDVCKNGKSIFQGKFEFFKD